MASDRTIRVMTYNVHSCVGTDAVLSPARVADVIAPYKPDIVALQELDVGRARSGKVDQAHAIAERLAMKFHFHPAIEVAEEKYGDAVLSRFHLRLVKAGALPTARARRHLQRRGALWVVAQWEGVTLNVVNTHLGLNRRERGAQARMLLGDEWTGHPDCRGPVILCGDFNAVPGTPAYRRFRRRFRTYPSRYPLIRIDHVFISDNLAVRHVAVPRTPLTRAASDHLPLIVDLELP